MSCLIILRETTADGWFSVPVREDTANGTRLWIVNEDSKEVVKSEACFVPFCPDSAVALAKGGA